MAMFVAVFAGMIFMRPPAGTVPEAGRSASS